MWTGGGWLDSAARLARAPLDTGVKVIDGRLQLALEISHVHGDVVQWRWRRSPNYGSAAALSAIENASA